MEKNVTVKDVFLDEGINLRFARSQSWIVTNYLLLLYAGLYVFGKRYNDQLEIEIGKIQFNVIAGLVYVVMVAGETILWTYYRWIVVSVTRLNSIHERFTCPDAKSVFIRSAKHHGILDKFVIIGVSAANIITGFIIAIAIA